MDDVSRENPGNTSEVAMFTMSKPKNHNVVWALLALIASLMVSNMIYQIQLADAITSQSASTFGIFVLIALTIVPYGAAYYLFKRFIDPINNVMNAGGKASPFFRFTHRLLQFAFYYNGAILGLTIIQVITQSGFLVGLTVLLLQANTLLIALIFVYLGYKFLSWYRSVRDIVILVFAATFLCITIGTVLSNWGQTVFFLLENPTRFEGEHKLPDSADGSGYFQTDNTRLNPQLGSLFLASQFFLRISFVLYWIGTAILLRKYSKSLGKLRYWILVITPVAAFAAGSVFDAANLGTQLIRGLVLPTSTLIGGILFALIFITISRGLGKSDRHDSLSAFLTMSAFGIILLLVTNTPPNNLAYWIHIPYPPFANVVWSFVGFAAYLYSFGLFFTTISISHDARLRKEIHSFTSEEAAMLHKLGSTQMKQEIQKRVVKVSKEQEALLKANTGVEQHLSDSEIQDYVKEVMDEVQKISKK